MLRALSGRKHLVMSGICLKRHRALLVSAATTRVWFAAISNREIDEYVATGEPLDKAGAYAIQGLAAKFVLRIDGCCANVVGLPVSLVYRHLRRMMPASY